MKNIVAYNEVGIYLRLIEQACGLRLLHGARRRRTQGACSSVPLALRWRRMLAARTTYLHLQVVWLCNAAAMHLRLIEQACGCSTL